MYYYSVYIHIYIYDAEIPCYFRTFRFSSWGHQLPTSGGAADRATALQDGGGEAGTFPTKSWYGDYPVVGRERVGRLWLYQLYPYPWRIHGAGIYANIKGVYWWNPWHTIYSSTVRIRHGIVLSSLATRSWELESVGASWNIEKHHGFQVGFVTATCQQLQLRRTRHGDGAMGPEKFKGGKARKNKSTGESNHFPPKKTLICWLEN